MRGLGVSFQTKDTLNAEVVQCSSNFWVPRLLRCYKALGFLTHCQVMKAPVYLNHKLHVNLSIFRQATWSAL